MMVRFLEGCMFHYKYTNWIESGTDIINLDRAVKISLTPNYVRVFFSNHLGDYHDFVFENADQTKRFYIDLVGRFGFKVTE